MQDITVDIAKVQTVLENRYLFKMEFGKNIFYKEEALLAGYRDMGYLGKKL